jgi:hypothetical protein
MGTIRVLPARGEPATKRVHVDSSGLRSRFNILALADGCQNGDLPLVQFGFTFPLGDNERSNICSCGGFSG